MNVVKSARQVLAAIEVGGGGRVRYATVVPDWVVELLDHWVRGFFDDVDEITLFDATGADVSRLGVLPLVRSLTVAGNKVWYGSKITPARLERLENLWRERRATSFPEGAQTLLQRYCKHGRLFG